jgi:hypothetical protein
MPIDPAFAKNHKVIGKHKNEDGRFYFVWGPGRSNAESSSNDQVQESYKTRGEEYLLLGIHGNLLEWIGTLLLQMEPV